MKLLLTVALFFAILANIWAQKIKTAPENDPKLRFAVQEIQPYLGGYEIELIANPERVNQACVENQLARPKWDTEQSYALRRKGNKIWVLSTNTIGAMYGGLDVAEALRTQHPEWLENKDQKPYLVERGLKFNIPLDLRTPSYTDASDAAQANIPEVWKEEFWQEYFDEMARQRMNVMTLWSLHPFPSMDGLTGLNENSTKWGF
jgi:hypothetical protein